MTLQQQWDIWLCASAMKYPYGKIFECIQKFSARMDIPIGKLQEQIQHRYPKGPSAPYCTITRFICGYIEHGADILYGEGNAIQKAMKLSKCRSFESPLDQHKITDASKERRKTRREYTQARISQTVKAIHDDAIGRSNWKACKGKTK